MIERYSLPKMSAIWQDEFKFQSMLEIELLVAEALASARKIPHASTARMRKNARVDLAEINRLEQATHHDVVAFVNSVSSRMGKDARYFHMGITSSDLLDTTLGLQLKKASLILVEDMENLLAALFSKAMKYKDMVCIGRTHGVHAEPVTFGFKLAVMFEEAKRDLNRLRKAAGEVSTGKISGAVGTYANIEPEVEQYVCRKLGLKPAVVSTQIIQRDIYAAYLSTLALVGASLEKFALEIRHLQRTEVNEAEEPFGKNQKGSSAMPHKRNPVICERICGLARLLRANAMTALENVALWHERDISHSSNERVIFADSTLVLDYMLNKFLYVIEGLVVHPDNMLSNLALSRGLIFSQRLLLELMNKGLARIKAYDIVQRNAMRAYDRKDNFKDVLLGDKQLMAILTPKELARVFDLDYYLRNIDKIFKRIRID